MTTLSEQDYQKVLTFLHELYIPGNLKDFSARVLAAIPKLVAADIPGYCAIDFIQDQLLDGSPLPGVSSSHVKEVVNQHFHEHPCIAHYSKTGDLGVYKLSDFVSKQQLYRLKTYQTFLRPISMEEPMGVILPHANSVNADAVVLLRSDRSFTERDRTILNLLQPHLMQARQTAHLFSQMQQENQQLHDSLNVAGGVVLSKDGGIQLMTRKAEQWLRQYFPFRQIGQSLPEHLQRWVRYQQSLLSQNGSLSKPRLPLKVEQDGKQLITRFVHDPVQERYVLLLEEQQQPKLSVESFELLGLSKREAEVFYWVAEGKENLEIADVLCVGVTTVRKHLEHIYQKLDVKTRTSAVVEALKRLGMLHCE